MLTSESHTGDNTTADLSATMFDEKTINSFTFATSKTIPITSTKYTKKDSGGIQYGTITTNTINANNQVTCAITKSGDLSGTTFINLNKTETTFGTYGNVSEAKTTDLTNNKVNDVTNTYDTNYSIYNTQSLQKDVKDVDDHYIVDPAGNNHDIVTMNTFDMFGRVVNSTNANGVTTATTYDACGNVLTTSLLNPTIVLSTNTNDFVNNIFTSTNRDGTGTKTEQDKLGNVLKSYRLNRDVRDIRDGAICPIWLDKIE